MKRIKKPLPFCWINSKTYISYTPKYLPAIFITLALLFSSNIFGQTACNCSKALKEIQLITSEITLGLPMTKSTRVPEQAIDGVGIEPDVFLKIDDLETMINIIVNHFNIK